MEIIIRKNVAGWWQTMSIRQVSVKNARAAYYRLAKKVNSYNTRRGIKQYAIDCINSETGEVVYHN